MNEDEVKTMVIFSFTTKTSEAEKHANNLKLLGVGDPIGFGSLSIIGLELNRRAADNLETKELIQAKVTNETEASKRDGPELSSTGKSVMQSLTAMRNEVKNTIKSRIAMDQVITLISGASEFSFDFVMLVVVASVIAACGLLTNSVVSIVASMLVSPIMGPILGVTFGVTIRDWNLVKKGLYSEFFALLICLLIGFLMGLGTAKVTYQNAVDRYKANDNIAIGINGWPVPEMSSRGQPESLVYGLLVAFFSGIGVALSVLGNNTTSLVGVAISASLLPPVVNTGILLGFAIRFESFRDDEIDSPDIVDHSSQDLLTMAGWSFALTVSNVILIFVAGIMMFYVKEVRRGDTKSDFWNKHLEETRNYNKIQGGDKEAKNLLDVVTRQLQEEDPGLFISTNNGYDGVFGDTLHNKVKNRWQKAALGTLGMSQQNVAQDSAQVDEGAHVGIKKEATNSSDLRQRSLHIMRLSKKDLTDTLKTMVSKRLDNALPQGMV
mmetsp:Transcript_8325/g.10855  ORF Transcript_8325/g.10855 Transcript_8325/m.10855 type:complete len:494 (+) Transcript_8325:152-1633(+)|eukprot:CAMPEP_0204867316 /NCGR_PEP_ID=MMETSP1348-20121228/22041_1 /ASSEMBLY_ACC=CAM_ASM_000700 /TAXON_ID=215587 /ORGANISM="Aplanochytrium stocchinoi, Strain GSBS06" /LENGTH=493 /DNA_ID=CAMNT_0052019683 /DNA_START=137 /DNA_END=1618 /DNA_ORIENTATION=-